MEEIMVLVPSHKIKALVSLMDSCTILCETGIATKNYENQRLCSQMLLEGCSLVKAFLDGGQKKEGGGG